MTITSRRINLLAALACAASAFAQTSQKLEFLSSPERTAVSEPLRELSSENPCMIVIDLTIDRSGRVTKSLASAPLSDCADLAVMKKAAEMARGFSFDPSPAAPSEQKARLTWNVGFAEMGTVDGPAGEGLLDVPPPPIEEPNDLFDAAAVQEQPQFPGGQEAMYAYLAKELKYPEDAKEAGIQGRVYLEFMVDKDGSITNVTLKRGVHASLDREAIRAVKAMPNWTPGRMNGKPVKVRWVMPVQFKMQ